MGAFFRIYTNTIAQPIRMSGQAIALDNRPVLAIVLDIDLIIKGSP